ncbi:MAG: diguanylate cyclase [Ruminococcus sp.]|uniref:sensor domain-containing diguanylate cyclase n=1 Tax=Ruminococcus sp. TaxID=41978 RepID=UPI0025CBDF92|nr:diguanylate cyclase [Ruminococcus sp.]MBO4865676.1 diguanylate cyclase [Ruminococcus sp.]
MDRKQTNVKTSMRNFLLALVLLLTTNILMGVILVNVSKNALRAQIEERMLDVSKTAAAQIDGDVLKNITAEDKDTEEYNRTLNILRSFQDNIELDYIYGVKPGPNNTFTFTIDPDREDPAEFGESIETTEALLSAGRGKSAVDKESHEDEWGRFYSSYSPIFDSEGNVVGVIGADFNAEWYDKALGSQTSVAVIVTCIALTIGIILSFIIMSQNRKRFIAMLNRLDDLDDVTQKIDKIIMAGSLKRLEMLPDADSTVLKTLASGETYDEHTPNEYEAVNSSIEKVYDKMRSFARYVEARSEIDGTTGVKNKACYRNRIKELDEQISVGKADFSAAFFDINGLKKIYTHHGFEAGEKLLFECAKVLKNVFGKENVYHVTGDEFIILTDQKQNWQMKDLFAEFEKELEKYNEEHVRDNILSVAKGFVTYDRKKHKNYRQVFVEVKAACDADKDEHYGRNKIEIQ